VISHGPKFREPQYINWKHNFKIIMDAGMFIEVMNDLWLARISSLSNEVGLYVG
jgi:hypothetical protein